MSKSSLKAVPLTGKFGFGTMSMTWTASPPPFEQSIETIAFAVSQGVHVLNGGEFYGADSSNLKLLQKYVATLSSEQKKDLVISIKGALNPETWAPDGSRAGVQKLIDNVLHYLGGPDRVKLIFEMARVDKNTPYEEGINTIGEYIEQGKLDGISLSETGPRSIKLALSTGYPISCVELELSIFTRDLITNGTLEELAKHGIPIVAYSPLARGLLTDSAAEDPQKWFNSMNDDSVQKRTERFQGDNLKANIELVQQLYKFAHEKKNTSLESLAISWIIALSERKEYAGIKNLPQILPNFSGSTIEKVKRNTKTVTLSEEDFLEIDEILKKYPVHGARYVKEIEDTLFQ